MALLGALPPLALGGGCFAPPLEPAGDGPAFEARGVELEVPLARGQLVARGARLTIADGGAELTVEGDASVSIEGAGELTARAKHLRARLAEQRLELTGAVRARLVVEGAADGGR